MLIIESQVFEKKSDPDGTRIRMTSVKVMYPSPIR